MSMVWQSGDQPAMRPVGAVGWVRVAVRGGALMTLVLTGLVIVLVLRLIERPLFGQTRPLTPYVTQTVCRLALHVVGLRLRVRGDPMHHRGAVVANHASWLDIFVLNAAQRVYFVAKSEVASWPLIGWAARATGTVFIRRRMREAAAQKHVFEQRLGAGHRLLFFPEGTSTDGQRVLRFKPTLFAAFFADGLHAHLWVQPVSVIYHAPAGCDVRFYGWWGDMGLVEHLRTVLAMRRNGWVEVRQHQPVRLTDFSDRKALASACGQAVRAGLEAGLETGIQTTVEAEITATP